jgi:hypothetical protein
MNMDNMREYLDKLGHIASEEQLDEKESKKFPKVFNDEGVLVANDPDSALELIADEVPEHVDMYMDAIRAGDHESLLDALDGFGYTFKYDEEDTLEEGGVKNMIIDVEDGMSKEEFEEKYPGQGKEYDEIKQEIMDRADETIETEEDCGCDEEAVDAMVSVPVQELADILQLAGYENYADKIEEYANEPEEEYSDTEDQLIGLSGGLNRPKKQYPASAPGDNPMDQEPREVEETMEAVEEKLYKSYKDFLEEEDAK